MTSALVLQLAVAAKVDLKYFRREGTSPLESARDRKHKECLAVLEAAGAT